MTDLDYQRPLNTDQDPNPYDLDPDERVTKERLNNWKKEKKEKNGIQNNFCR